MTRSPYRRRCPLLASLLTSGLSALVAGLLSMTVPWALLSAGQSASVAGTAAFALQLPVALGMLLGGRLVDRGGPRRVLMLSNLLAATLTGAAALLALGSGTYGLPTVAGIVALLAVANFCGQPGTLAQDARIPELARLAALPLERANGLREIVMSLGMMGGPAAAVLLVAGIGLAYTLIVAAGLSLLIALIDAACFPAFQAKRGGNAGQAPVPILRDPLLGSVAVIGALLVAVFSAMDEIVAPALVIASGLGAGDLALFLTIAGGSVMLANLLFALLGQALGRRIGHRGLFIGGVGVMWVGTVLLAALPPAMALVVAPILIGLGVGPLWPLVVTVIHRQVPPQDRGQVIGTLSATVMLAQPMAALAAGPAVDSLGTGTMTWLIALLVGAALAISIFSKGVRRLHRARGSA
jgi:MFS family permease